MAIYDDVAALLEKQDFEGIKPYLDREPTFTVNEGAYAGYNILMLAAALGKQTMVQSILSAYPKSKEYVVPEGENKGHFAASSALRDGQPGITRQILNATPYHQFPAKFEVDTEHKPSQRVIQNLLMNGLIFDDSLLVDFAIKHGADPFYVAQDDSVLKQSALNYAFDKNRRYLTTLFSAGYSWQTKSPNWVIGGYPLPEPHENLLAFAIACKEPRLIDFAIEQGQDISSKFRYSSCKDGVLKRKGKSPTNSTALHLACMDRNVEMVRLLIQKGIDFNMANSDGDTALHLAVELGYPDIAKVLIESGADRLMKNRQNKNSLELMRESIFPEFKVLDEELARSKPIKPFYYQYLKEAPKMLFLGNIDDPVSKVSVSSLDDMEIIFNNDAFKPSRRANAIGRKGNSLSFTKVSASGGVQHQLNQLNILLDIMFTYLKGQSPSTK